MALVQLGTFQFHIGSLPYSQLRHRSSVRWSRQNIIGSEDRLQAVGRDNDRIRLSGVFYPQVAAMVGGTVGTKSIDDLRAMMKQMQPQILVSPNGENLGYWVIEDVDADNSIYAKGTGSTPRRQEFEIRLRWFGHVPPGTAAPGAANPAPPPVVRTEVERQEFIPMRFGPRSEFSSFSTIEPVGFSVPRPKFDEIQRVDSQNRALRGNTTQFERQSTVNLGKANANNFIVRDPETAVRRIAAGAAQQEIRKLQRLAEDGAAYPIRRFEDGVDGTSIGNWTLEKLDINQPKFGRRDIDTFSLRMRWSS